MPAPGAQRPGAVLLFLLLAAACAGGPKVILPGTVAAADGTAIAYEARGRGEPALVFVHGWCCDRWSFHRQLDEFARDHLVVALDLGGHGASGRQRRSDWSLPTLAGDVQAVVERLDLERVVLVGHSMGGPVALLAAARMRGRVLGVVGIETLHDPDLRLTPEMAEAQAARFEADFPRTMADAVRGMWGPASDGPTVAALTERAGGTDQAAALAIVRAWPEVDFGRIVARAGVPIRLINAARPETRSERLRELGDVAVTIMPGVGHYPMLQRPRELSAHLRAAIASIVAARGR